MAKKTVKITLALALIAMMSVPAGFAATSTKSFTLSVTIPERIQIPVTEIQPIDLNERISGFSVKEYNIRYIEITEIVQRDEPVYLKSIVAL